MTLAAKSSDFRAKNDAEGAAVSGLGMALTILAPSMCKAAVVAVSYAAVVG